MTKKRRNPVNSNLQQPISVSLPNATVNRSIFGIKLQQPIGVMLFIGATIAVLASCLWLLNPSVGKLSGSIVAKGVVRTNYNSSLHDNISPACG